jgi:hypothetical protein
VQDQKTLGSFSLIDVLDRVLDKGIQVPWSRDGNDIIDVGANGHWARAAGTGR